MCSYPSEYKAVFPVGHLDQEYSKKNPSQKMAADRQVQPNEPDKGTNNTQMYLFFFKNTH